MGLAISWQLCVLRKSFGGAGANQVVDFSHPFSRCVHLTSENRGVCCAKEAKQVFAGGIQVSFRPVVEETEVEPVAFRFVGICI